VRLEPRQLLLRVRGPLRHPAGGPAAGARCRGPGGPARGWRGHQRRWQREFIHRRQRLRARPEATESQWRPAQEEDQRPVRLTASLNPNLLIPTSPGSLNTGFIGCCF
jgi:hypothetical protein